jgi:hypothetical protein
MNAGTYIAAALVAAVALVVILYLLGAIGAGLFGQFSFFRGVVSPRAWLSHRQLRRKQQLVAQLDELDNDSFSPRLRSLLMQAFMLGFRPYDREQADRIHDLHLAILRFLVRQADRRRVMISNLPKIEDLVETRALLFKAYLESQQTRRRIRSKAKEKPWVLEQLGKQDRGLAADLADNRRSLEVELHQAFDTLAAADSGANQVVYH